MKKALCLFTLLSIQFILPRANADTVNLVTTRPTGTDLVDWGQLGPNETVLSNPFTATSAGGIGVTGQTTGNQGYSPVLAQNYGVPGPGSFWSGNFAPGDYLIWTVFNGPLTLNFSTGVSQVGAQIQQGVFAPFIGQVCDNLGDCFTEDGVSDQINDNSAIYIGLNDASGANITSVTFSLGDCNGPCENTEFAINQLSLDVIPAPEPNSAFLLFVGLACLLSISVRRCTH